MLNAKLLLLLTTLAVLSTVNSINLPYTPYSSATPTGTASDAIPASSAATLGAIAEDEYYSEATAWKSKYSMAINARLNFCGKGCIKCSKFSNTFTSNICTKCVDAGLKFIGTYKQQCDVLKEVVQPIANCKENGVRALRNACVSCKEGFFNDHNFGCVACSATGTTNVWTGYGCLPRVTAIANCTEQSMSNPLVCGKCSAGFYANNSGVCTATTITGCKTFFSNNGNCEVCTVAGFTASGSGNCEAPATPVVANCTTDRSPTTCLQCKPGFYLKSFDSTCVALTTKNPNCISQKETSGVSKCLICAAGFELTNGFCVKMLEGCKEMDYYKDYCKECDIENGWFVVDKLDSELICGKETLKAYNAFLIGTGALLLMIIFQF